MLRRAESCVGTRPGTGRKIHNVEHAEAGDLRCVNGRLGPCAGSRTVTDIENALQLRDQFETSEAAAWVSCDTHIPWAGWASLRSFVTSAGLSARSSP